MADVTTITPHVLTYIQQHAIVQLSNQFAWIRHAAMSLFAIVATIELALFGVVWALRQDTGFAALILKIFKLGVIFFLISAYPYLLQHLIDGFSQIAVHGHHSATGYLFNPAHLWQYGFDGAISLLKLSVTYGTANVGMSMIYLVLGFTILLGFSLIGAQVLLVVLGFYVVSLLALLLLPLGTLGVARGLLHRALQAVIAAGARVFGLILILSIAVQTWQHFALTSWGQTTTLMAPLGLLTSVIVFGYLLVRVPSWCAQAVGDVGGSVFTEQGSSEVVQANTHSVSPSVYNVAAGSVITPIGTAATTVNTGMTSAQTMQAATQMTPSHQTVNVQASVSGLSGSANKLASVADKLNKTTSGAQVNQGVSQSTLRKLKARFK